ncbi:3',5'-cyclic AMP phosphodiesterase CpdA [Pseudomonas helmanticensis]|uniref:3',5'-cyclic AMP phosphodiesterase CpdA n=1 Tax=Pseudomonas helmanticensis TaxID=1471381 RepID=A0ACD2U114_9PSED|nr:metallophosphoesterase [Pseudomonas helmanticensis]SMQ23236.1 3',5'-cyclic AMP phosphodiesterase CpdA [Pseudomonas helmanticensis]
MDMHTKSQRRTDSLLNPDRRALLKCSAWVGAGVIWALHGGIPKAFALDAAGNVSDPKAFASTFHFVQISDSHIGFNKEANPEPVKTLQVAIDKVIALPKRPSLILHTGDITHLSKAEEFDTAAQLLKALPATVHYVPGEHDTLDAGGGALYLQRYGKGTKGNGWYSFDDHGVHFIALVNVFNFQAGREANLGADQLAWLADDLRAVSSSTPIVVFTHIPLWTIYQPWGWGTEDGDQAIAMLRKYGSVTVLNGHIHQVIQKVEGNITFHTARGTAYPQPAPGAAPSPGPMTVAADQLRNYLGLTDVRATQGDHPLALIDSTLV